jgi:hypothetical protein
MYLGMKGLVALPAGDERFKQLLAGSNRSPRSGETGAVGR